MSKYGMTPLIILFSLFFIKECIGLLYKKYKKLDKEIRGFGDYKKSIQKYMIYGGFFTAFLMFIFFPECNIFLNIILIPVFLGLPIFALLKIILIKLKEKWTIRNIFIINSYSYNVHPVTFYATWIASFLFGLFLFLVNYVIL